MESKHFVTYVDVYDDNVSPPARARHVSCKGHLHLNYDFGDYKALKFAKPNELGCIAQSSVQITSGSQCKPRQKRNTKCFEACCVASGMPEVGLEPTATRLKA